MSSDTTVTVREGRSRETVLLIVLGVVVVLGLLWWFVLQPLLLGDDGDDLEPSAQPTVDVTIDADGDGVPDDVPSPNPGSTGEPGVPQPEPTAVGEELPVETYQIFLNRDPFAPVVPDEDGGNGGTGGTDGGTTGGTDGGTTGGTDGGDGGTDGGDGGDGGTDGGTNGGNGGNGGSTGNCTGSDEVVCDGRVVTLVDVFREDGADQAVIQVDSELYTVGEGDTFATSFRVLSIDSPCVTLLYGDDRFVLCEGDRVLK